MGEDVIACEVCLGLAARAASGNSSSFRAAAEAVLDLGGSGDCGMGELDEAAWIAIPWEVIGEVPKYPSKTADCWTFGESSGSAGVRDEGGGAYASTS